MNKPLIVALGVFLSFASGAQEARSGVGPIQLFQDTHNLFLWVSNCPHLATLHMALHGEPDFELRLVAATTPDGSAIGAAVSFAKLNDNPQERPRCTNRSDSHSRS